MPFFWAALRNQTRTTRLINISMRQEGLIPMNGIIYLVGLVVIVMAILSWIGLS
jgi:hypothetical protein